MVTTSRRRPKDVSSRLDVCAFGTRGRVEPEAAWGRPTRSGSGLLGGLELFTQMATTRQQVLLETLAARQRAAELLKTLEQARCECEAQLKTEQRQDAMKTVTGKSSIESAIAQTKRMVELLDRAL